MRTKRLIEEIDKEAAAFHETIKATDPRLRGSVYLQHEDGSTFFWEDAFAVRVDGDDWLAIFTEHHRWHVYAMSDIYCVRLFERSIPAPVADWQDQNP